jgi:hypothetical protein
MLKVLQQQVFVEKYCVAPVQNASKKNNSLPVLYALKGQDP